MMTADTTVGFASDIKPLFRESDRESMRKAFDLWSYDDVVKFQNAILERLADGSMPCDAPWKSDDIERLRTWIAQGSRP